MASPLRLATLAILAVDGIAFLAIAADVRRRYNSPESASFSWFSAVLGVVALLAASLVMDSTVNAVNFPYLVLLFAIVPWSAFALTYTGRGEVVTRSRIAAFLLGVGALVAIQTFTQGSLPGSALVLIGIMNWFIAVAVAFVGALLIVSTTLRYGHLSLGLGSTLSIAAIEPWFLYAVLFNGTAVPEQFALVLYAGGITITSVSLAAAVYRYDALDATAAAGTVGREVMVDEIEDPLVVVDEDERIIETNPAAAELMDRQGFIGDRLTDHFESGIEQFRDAPDVSLTTEDGQRVFDAQVTEFTDQHDTVLGHVVALRDVTDRQLRQQRLEVLNRVLRHNLRNKLTAVQGNAKLLADGDGPTEPASQIANAAEDLVDLSETARETERLLRQDGPVERVTVRSVVDGLIDEIGDQYPSASLSCDVPSDLELRTQRSLLVHALENLLENAVEHNDSSEPTVTVTAEEHEAGARIAIADDGPGIPNHERAVVTRGEETPLDHGSGFGLWATKWAVIQLGGALGFDEADEGGAVVRIELPPSTLPE